MMQHAYRALSGRCMRRRARREADPFPVPGPVSFAVGFLMVGAAAIAMSAFARTSAVGGRPAERLAGGTVLLLPPRPEADEPAQEDPHDPEAPPQTLARSEPEPDPEPVEPEIIVPLDEPARVERAEYVSAPAVPAASDGRRELTDDGTSAGPAPIREPIDLAAALPAEAAEVFEERLAAGDRLRREGVRAPAYQADLDEAFVDGLVMRGLARVAVLDGSAPQARRMVLFDGGATSPGAPAFARPGELRGFSGRVVLLHTVWSGGLVDVVASTFVRDPGALRPSLVIRHQLDLAVLAAQSGAARRLGVPLDDVRRTTGRFRTAAGLPFDYEVRTVELEDGERRVVPPGG